MFEKIYNLYKGYVEIRVKSNQTERFLNLAVNNNIYIWNLRRISENEITFSVSVKGFLSLRRVAYETRSRIKILSKRGYPRLMKKILKRKIILIGGFFCILITLFLSSLILDIEINGNVTVSDEVILKKLSEIDLKKFAFRGNIDTDRISLALINGTDRISWVGVTEKGCRLLIEIKERTPPPEMIPLDIPCHIVAKRDGIIYKMNIENGEPTVKLNEVVREGQLLVSGIIDTKYDGMRYVHSMGTILARTWAEKICEVKLYEYKKEFTGRKTGKCILKLFGKEFDLSFGRVIPYYNSRETEKRTVIGFVELLNREYEEYTLKKVPLSEEQAIERGKQELYQLLMSEYEEDKVTGVEYQVTVTDSETRKIRMLANTVEEIGKTIIINNSRG